MNVSQAIIATQMQTALTQSDLTTVLVTVDSKEMDSIVLVSSIKKYNEDENSDMFMSIFMPKESSYENNIIPERT